MEFFEYIKYFYNYWKWMVVGVVLGGLALGILAYAAADSYRANVAILVLRAAEEPSAEYFTYEGYYAQQTAAEYSKTVLELLKNDEIVRRAAEYAELPTDASSIIDIKDHIVTQQDAPQLIQVSVTMPEREQASALADGLSQAVANRTAEVNQYGDRDLYIEQVDESPFVVLVRPLLWLYVAIGSALGLVAAMLATAFWVYGKSQRVAAKK